MPLEKPRGSTRQIPKELCQWFERPFHFLRILPFGCCWGCCSPLASSSVELILFYYYDILNLDVLFPNIEIFRIKLYYFSPYTYNTNLSISISGISLSMSSISSAFSYSSCSCRLKICLRLYSSKVLIQAGFYGGWAFKLTEPRITSFFSFSARLSRYGMWRMWKWIEIYQRYSGWGRQDQLYILLLRSMWCRVEATNAQGMNAWSLPKG